MSLVFINTRVLIAAVILLLLSGIANAAGTKANTTISNTATVQYSRLGVSQSALASVSISVAEVLDVTATWQDAANVNVMSPSSTQVLTFLVVNTGNGVEDIILNVATPNTVPDFDPTAVQVWEDTDGNNLFSSINDTQIPLGNTISLDGGTPGSDSQVVFLVSDIPAGIAVGNIGNVELIATSSTANANSVVGSVTSIIANAGDGLSIDALVGASGAEGRVIGRYEVVPSVVTITKTETIVDNRGGNVPYPGSTIRYSLLVDVTGASPVNNLLITDVIPSFTSYDALTDSIVLDGILQTNADDAPADFTNFNAGTNTVSVDLSRGGVFSVVPPQSFTISFDVTIN